MYSFDKKDIAAQSLIHLINHVLPNDSVGIEIGTHIATTACGLVQNCSNIKTLYTVDSWKPYTDFLKTKCDGTPNYSVDEKQIEYYKMVAYHHIKFSGVTEKIIVLEMDSNLAATKFEENTLNFIFLDAQLSKEQMENDLEVWYPKLKSGGILSGHDWFSDGVKLPTLEFREKNNIKSKMSVFDNTFVWIKNT